MRSVFGAALPLALLLSTAAMAQQGQSVFYGGAGQALDDDLDVSSIPFSFGVFRQSDVSRVVAGVDFAGEGSMLDSTYGDNEVRQALSFNLLLGANVAKTARARFDVAALLGVRETFADCPDSYLGYQCYADQAPSTEYGVNYGAMASVSFDRTMVGLRATGESVQVVVGFRF